MNTHHIQGANGQTVTASPQLEDFHLFQKESSNIAYFGTAHLAGQLFVQFKHGGSYVHSLVPSDTLKGMENADSIGSYYSKNIRGTYPSAKVEWTVNA